MRSLQDFKIVGYVLINCKPFHNFLITNLPITEKNGYLTLDFTQILIKNYILGKIVQIHNHLYLKKYK